MANLKIIAILTICIFSINHAMDDSLRASSAHQVGENGTAITTIDQSKKILAEELINAIKNCDEINVRSVINTVNGNLATLNAYFTIPPVYIAIGKRSSVILQLLLKAGASPYFLVNGEPILNLFIKNLREISEEEYRIIYLLVHYSGANNLKSSDSEGRTALYIAARNHKPQLVEFFLKA